MLHFPNFGLYLKEIKDKDKESKDEKTNSTPRSSANKSPR